MDGQYVGRVIYPHLKEMLDDARSEGVYMFIRSGYRSYASQESVLNSFINKYRNRGYSYEEARRLALQTASLPGCSEHQSGLAVDINATGGTSSYTAYAWLAKNAYKYGFILRYPSGKESITGIKYEPWHYRYVGIGEAEKIIRFCNILIRMNGVAVTAERRNHQVILFEHIAKIIKSLFIVKKNVGIGVCFSGITAATYFNSLNAERCEVFRGFRKRNVRKKICKNSEFHIRKPP